MPKIVDHDERRLELARAVWQVIAQRGIDNVTVREIAREAGYSSGALSHYFDGKDDLLVTALRVTHQQMAQRYDEAVDTPLRHDALRAVLMDNLPLDEERDLETRVEMSFWARSLRNEHLSAIQHTESAALQEHIAELVDGSQTEGEIDAGHDPNLVVELLATLIDGISLHALLYPDRIDVAEQQRIMDFALRLLAGGD